MTPKATKRPKIASGLGPPAGGRQPRTVLADRAPDGAHAHPVFSFKHVDRHYDGEWGWPKLTPEKAKELWDYTFEMSVLTWKDIRSQTSGKRKRNHDHEVARLCREAQDRLAELKLDDVDELFRFRLSGKARLWGIVADGIFHAVWWDPEHRVYPPDD